MIEPTDAQRLGADPNVRYAARDVVSGVAAAVKQNARPGRELGRAAIYLARLVEVAVNELDLSLAQYRVLAGVADGRNRAVHLSESLEVTRPAISLAVEGLVTRGYLERRVDQSDRRRLILSLTRSGRDVLAAADDVLERKMSEVLDLSVDAQPKAADTAHHVWEIAHLAMAYADNRARTLSDGRSG